MFLFRLPIFRLLRLAACLALSWLGVVGMALIGTWLIGRAMVEVITKEEETEPTQVKLAGLRSEKPRQEWLTVAGGVMYWPEAMTMLRETKTRSGKKLSVKEQAMYVPLVSPEVRDEWFEMTARTGGLGRLDYSGCDVLLVIRPTVSPTDYPQDVTKMTSPSVEQLAPEYTPTGLVLSNDELDEDTRRELAKVTPQLDLKRVMILEVGGRPTSSTDRGVLVLFGLGLLIPCALKAVFGAKLSNWLYQPEENDGSRPLV